MPLRIYYLLDPSNKYLRSQLLATLLILVTVDMTQKSPNGLFLFL
ncbi:hypothetical protein PALI_b0606 [Pseudoalteromonas aliena SW19]|uniref:Uncharacterized protein n=1 Tax=Pseudoalteromonas aliena SW19 TaxID=1314866 RepID=A0ABR9E4S4_9GAMM|nr:hypothetical protein [Pseudoalteromonas aliena SW19]